MPDDGFNPEQQEYLKGFMAGVEARRGALTPAAGSGGAPADALRAAQDRDAGRRRQAGAAGTGQARQAPAGPLGRADGARRGGQIPQADR